MKKWFCFFLHRFCVRDLSGFVGDLCVLFFRVFARIIWLVLKVKQHVSMLVWVNLTTFDKISTCFTIKNR